MKKVLIILGIILILVVGYFLLNKDKSVSKGTSSEESEIVQVSDGTEDVPAGARTVVEPGDYTVIPEESVVNWSGKKPLISGYVNTGTLSLVSGNIDVTEKDATGEFVLDMDTLSVSKTAKKPGQENTLEGHLKSENWFDVARYPEARFVITKVSPRADSEETYIYDVTGELTLKGETGELTFPATIYTDDLGRLRAEANFEFDRTKWGLTFGSGSFFDGLADNVIDDMVAMSFVLIAEER